MSSGVCIELKHLVRSYFAGQVIKGSVVVSNYDDLKVKEITVLLHGQGRVYFSETGPVSERKKAISNFDYTCSEIYVYQKLSLAGDGQNFIELANGTSYYPFEFLLPQSCPSSFDSEYGSISYSVEAELRRGLLKPNKRMTLPITVNGMNLFVTIKPQKVVKIKTGNFLLARSGVVELLLKLPKKSGFIPGEVLDFVAQVTNASNKNISGLTAKFTQATLFHAEGKTNYLENTIREVKGPQVEANIRVKWMPQNLIIPLLPPTTLEDTCRIIAVQYVIVVTVHFPGLSSSLSAKLPVFIGTVPLMHTVFGPNQEVDRGNQLSVPSIKSTLSSEKPEQPNTQEKLPPPTYEEAVSSKGFNWNLAREDGNKGHDDNIKGST